MQLEEDGGRWRQVEASRSRWTFIKADESSERHVKVCFEDWLKTSGRHKDTDGDKCRLMEVGGGRRRQVEVIGGV
jgi:hypothetical protein